MNRVMLDTLEVISGVSQSVTSLGTPQKFDQHVLTSSSMGGEAKLLLPQIIPFALRGPNEVTKVTFHADGSLFCYQSVYSSGDNRWFSLSQYDFKGQRTTRNVSASVDLRKVNYGNVQAVSFALDFGKDAQGRAIVVTHTLWEAKGFVFEIASSNLTADEIALLVTTIGQKKRG